MRIVTAQNLQSWSDSLNARADLPGIVADLIRASCPRLESYRFPSGDASQAHGFDGVADVEVGNVFVPVGRSRWEFGAGKDYKAKAEKDYRKRTDQLTAEERSKQTFTFVTSRKWEGGPEGWEAEHSQDGWLKVRILDAVSLEHWLSDHPTVSLPLARGLGVIPPSGVRTVPEFWEEYRLNFEPPLTADILLNGRRKLAEQLSQALSAGIPDLSRWQAGSPEEAAAFIAASIMTADPETSKFLISKTLILETKEAAQTVPRNSQFTFILEPAASSVGPALARTSQVILVLGTDDLTGESQKLERMNTIDFAAGLKSMGIEEHEAFQLAGICGRSLTVLWRLKRSATAPRPKWHDDAKLVPIVLAGGWDASNEHDCALVAKLCNTDYESVDAEARRLSSLVDAPLDLEGSIWTLRSPMDAFILTGCLIDSASQARLREACTIVFSERDRTLDVPADDSPLIPVRGDDFQHSEWLRRGLARTLLLISGLHNAARLKVTDGTPEQYVERAVASIPRLAEDVGVLASLKSELPTLAEAAPRPLASALERVLGGDRSTWAPTIFRDKDASFWNSSSPHTYLLWALETMAWDPDYLHRAASILMRLADSDPGGKLANRPLNSLREVFLAWRPNTYASVEERIAILRSICNKYPRIGLDLMRSLLPTTYDHSSGTSKPQIRDFGEARSEPTTHANIRLSFEQYAKLAVELAGTDIALLTELVENLPQLDPSTRKRATSAMKTAAQQATPDAVFQLWSKLRDLIQKHQDFQDAQWALKAHELEPLEVLCRAIEPPDPISRIRWLFDDYAPKSSRNSSDYMGDANRHRQEAISSILQNQGIAAVLDLARTAKLPHFVGYALAESKPRLEILQHAVAATIAPESGVNADFAIAISAAAHVTHGREWDSWIGELAKKLVPDVAVILFLRWEDSAASWDFIGKLSPEIEREYWRRKWVFRPSSDAELTIAFSKYANVGRFTAILDMVAYHEEMLSTSQCIEALRGLTGELNKNPLKLQRSSFEIVHMMQALQQRDDINLEELAALEYQYLPILQFQAEPIALNRLLGKSPELFVSVISDVFSPDSGRTAEPTEDSRSRARLGYQLLRSINVVPGFESGATDSAHLRSWISAVRELAKLADRITITDEQIGQILAYAPVDREDDAWPTKPIRDLIEDLASEHIERGIAISRFNQRGVVRKSPYEGGQKERALVDQYRNWADTTRNWPRTSVLLRHIAAGWEADANRADTEAELDQLRDRV